MTRRTLRYVRYRACAGKRRYFGKREAFRAASSATERSGKRHRAYKCDYGDHYHITHLSKALFDNHERNTP